MIIDDCGESVNDPPTFKHARRATFGDVLLATFFLTHQEFAATLLISLHS
jgi:hypothetical protein